jgi:hypothetical protein
VKLAKREKSIIALLVVVAAGVGIYYLAVQPYLDRRQEISTGEEQTGGKLTKAKSLFDQQDQMRKVWVEMQADGLNQNASQAEGRALHALLSWAQESGVALSSLKSQRATQVGTFQAISLDATGTGSSAQIARLLWALETAKTPIRVNDLQITSRPEGTDNLSMRLSVSALCMPPEQGRPQ